MKTKHSLGQLIEPGTLRMERTLAAPIERVWAYLTDPDKRATWLAGGTMTQEIGGVFELRFEHTRLTDEEAPERFAGYRKPHLQKSRLLRSEPPTLLTISWDEDPAPSEVTFELTPEGNGTRLVLTHRRLADRKETLSVAGGWHAHLDVLIDVLQGDRPQGFWTNLEAVEKAYEAHIR
ncbi:SRPBCC family protein [Variovorax sp. GB1P17]|uniref:SRPBCC family protein n=1 Tax=Variovorax sp. GB1P17 TaxID=3443740 RepID=UPI003F483808